MKMALIIKLLGFFVISQAHLHAFRTVASCSWFQIGDVLSGSSCDVEMMKEFSLTPTWLYRSKLFEKKSGFHWTPRSAGGEACGQIWTTPKIQLQLHSFIYTDVNTFKGYIHIYPFKGIKVAVPWRMWWFTKHARELLNILYKVQDVEKPLPLSCNSCLLCLVVTPSHTAWLNTCSSCFCMQWLMAYCTRCFRHNSTPEMVFTFCLYPYGIVSFSMM